ncbi:MAG: hypothetical protein Q9174_005960 [Haloplaca sp. 1 TL-2023]
MDQTPPTRTYEFPDELTQMEELNVDDATTLEADSCCDHTDVASVASDGSDESVIEAFEDYKTKIEQLLEDIGSKDYDIEVVQHGYNFMNCVYALTSTRSAEHYILRVTHGGFYRDSDGKHETVEKEIVLLGHLKDKLPVPEIKAYCLTKDNHLEAAFTLQTRIEGESLNRLWPTMDLADKYKIVDEFISLLVNLETVTFPTAGTFAVSENLPSYSNEPINTDIPAINVFDAFADEPTQDPQILQDRSGHDIKALLTSHLDKWIQQEQAEDQNILTPKLEALRTMLTDMEEEGVFAHPFPIILHHCDLEPRNIMVARSAEDGHYHITGIIDWDDAVALPQPLARIPPRWIWHFPDQDPDLEDGYLNDDQYPDPELSEEGKALKTYFAEKVEGVLEGYEEEAESWGRWLRRVWYFAKEGAYRQYEWDFLDRLPEEWARREKEIVEGPVEGESDGKEGGEC